MIWEVGGEIRWLLKPLFVEQKSHALPYFVSSRFRPLDFLYF